MILLITHSEDFYNIDLVKGALTKLGYDSMRINSDDFPMKWSLSESLGLNGKVITIFIADQKISLSDVQGVWLRKYWSPKISDEIDEQYKDGCFRESKAVMDILINQLQNVPMIDPIERIINGENKFLQLELAQKHDIDIPNTLITNNPEELKEFYNNSSTELVAKMLTPLTVSMDGSSAFVFTSKLTEEMLNDADLLRDCPMVFQELIEKEYELRVIYVSGNFYLGKIDASKTAAGKVDWRQSKPGEVQWENGELPGELKDKICNLMNDLGLVYGALDIIKAKDGRYVFLEVNPCGEWGMLQKELDLPIAEAIAKALVMRIEN
ncbi:MAG: MvdC family ATP-grasp ribosomal peptide maturase [Bacteroidetes bacterium]|nr:MAG: MvdC family ATP-grasp ribosomal peptide maturase [Bacteroidota bacterium]